MCDNCKRIGSDVSLELFSYQEVKKKRKMMYYSVVDEQRLMIALCSCCERYLMGAKKKNYIEDYWPAMLFSFLNHHDSSGLKKSVSFQDKWKLVPIQWRYWWQDYFSMQIGDEEEEPVFRDMTTELSQMKTVLRKLRWVDLANCMDEHFAFPEIRCPFGCSEFLHKVNHIPLEDFLWYYSNYDMPLYNSPSGRSWVDSISPSFPSSVLILERFKCSPALAVVDGKPVILSCREHTKHNTAAILHVPESASGTVYAPNANGLASVAIRARTNRSFKGNSHNDTFCTVKLVGGFCGMDTHYITSPMTCEKCDTLSFMRNALVIQGRPDIKCQLYGRSFDKSEAGYMPERAVEEIISFAEDLYPDPSGLFEASTSTFISCEQAIELQEKIYNEGSQILKVYADELSTNVPVERLFSPPWPTYILKVHPADGYGERFYRLKETSVFSIWVLLSLSGHICELWRSMAESVEDNIHWLGHWLRYAAKELHLKVKNNGDSRFKLKKIKDVVSLFDPPLYNTLSDHHRMASLFSKCEDVHVIDGSSRDVARDECLQNVAANVVICINPNYEVLRQVDCLWEMFELRYLLLASDESKYKTWVTYARHAGQKWWVQTHGQAHFSKHDGSSIEDVDWKNGRIAVFCKNKTLNPVGLQRRYLKAIGGQDHVFCGVHKCPLVLNHYRQKKGESFVYKCLCGQTCGGDDNEIEVVDKCGLYAKYICPNFAVCKSAICEKHLAAAKNCCLEKTPETVLFVSHSGEEYKEYLVQEKGALRNRETIDSRQRKVDRCNAESLGPTAAYDVPQDILEMDVDDENYDEEEAHTENWVGTEDEPMGTIWDTCTQRRSEEHDQQLKVSYQQADDESIEDMVHDELEHSKVQPSLICTHAGGRNPQLNVLQRDGSRVSFPVSIVLNRQGHILSRKHGKLRMHKACRSFFEKIVSKSDSEVVPLLYAEAQLFPSIFWQSLQDGTVAGALPTALWCDSRTLKTLGVENLRGHAKNRITNPALLCSVDPSYHFLLMDELVNLGLRGKDTRLILHRGFADEQGPEGVQFRSSSDSAELYGESTENEANVHKLSALVRERCPHFFFTQSCNQSTCRGLRRVREWVTSHEAAALLKRKYGLECDAAWRYLRESAASYILRSWNEVADMWMNYIINSEEEPIGKIEYGWYRKEFQGTLKLNCDSNCNSVVLVSIYFAPVLRTETQGNPSHIHAILRTTCDVSDPAGLKEVLSKIRGCIADLIHRKEYLEMQEEGVISSTDHLIEILEQAKRFLSHKCHDRCKIPRMDKNGDQVFICKVKNNFDRNFTPFRHTLQPVNEFHNSAAKAIYNRLGMMEGDKILEACLESEVHVPICSSFDAKFSPTNGRLFACYPSAQNLQFTTGRTITSYLCKYVAGLDDVALIVVGSEKTSERGHAKAVIETLNNTKISSNKLRADEKKKRTATSGRLLTQMEALTVTLGAPLVTSTETFVHIPTSPREYRAAFSKYEIGNGRAEEIPDFMTNGAVINQDIRRFKAFPEARLFSDHQLEVIKDEQISTLTMDKISVFSVRPPELRFVDSVSLYFKWFERTKTFHCSKRDELETQYTKALSRDLQSCQWIDGLGGRLLLRRGAIDAITEYACKSANTAFGSPPGRLKQQICSLLKQIQKLHKEFDLNINPSRSSRGDSSCRRVQYKQLARLFLSKSKSMKLPTPWVTTVYPKNKTRFLIHILLYFGRFETEYGLMALGNMKDAFIKAGLFDPAKPQCSLDDLMRRYIRECLAYQPGSVFQHDRCLVLAQFAFSELLLGTADDDQVVMHTPCVLQASMLDETKKKIETARKKYLKAFVTTIFHDLSLSGFSVDKLPDKELILQFEKFRVDYNYPPAFNEQGQQGRASYEEQRSVLMKAKDALHRYQSGRSHKNLVICGGPGNGKTTVCEEICLYAFSLGLTGIATSIVADRSKALGGIHIHLLCSISGRRGTTSSPGATAEAAIAKLYRKPELFNFWKRLDFICIDEFGAVSAEMLATIDIIARHIKRSSAFMGGMMVLATMDIFQLLPFRGTPLLLSMNTTSEFNFCELKHSVRAANDANLRRICDLSRTTNWTAGKRTEFKNLIKNNCKFVASFDDPSIPHDGIYVFGRKAPCKKIEGLVIKRMQAIPGIKQAVSLSFDEESTKDGNWKSASDPAIKEISKRVKPPRELYLFENGRYEFTYNDPSGAFQQGQLAILLRFDEDDVTSKNKLQFYKGPPGCKEYPPLDKYTNEHLESIGWTKVHVPYETSESESIYTNLLGRRTQYGVRLRVASTIHASMGSTYGTLVTAVTTVSSHSDLNFSLWEAAQVVVLISRTRACSDIYFVGDPDEVVNHLLAVLENISRFTPHIRTLQAKLCGLEHHTPIFDKPPVFRPCDVVLQRVPAVYLLVSTREYGYMYIGETKDIRKRLNNHNSGQGSAFTNNSRLRPWAVFGYVYNLGSRKQRRLFEQWWKRNAMKNNNRDRSCDPYGLMTIARDLAEIKNRTRVEDTKLRIQLCGEMGPASTSTYDLVHDT